MLIYVSQFGTMTNATGSMQQAGGSGIILFQYSMSREKNQPLIPGDQLLYKYISNIMEGFLMGL